GSTWPSGKRMVAPRRTGNTSERQRAANASNTAARQKKVTSGSAGLVQHRGRASHERVEPVGLPPGPLQPKRRVAAVGRGPLTPAEAAPGRGDERAQLKPPPRPLATRRHASLSLQDGDTQAWPPVRQGRRGLLAGEGPPILPAPAQSEREWSRAMSDA